MGYYFRHDAGGRVTVNENYATVVVGTGFASSFFLQEYLRHAAPNDRVLVLEWGQRGSAPPEAGAAVPDPLFVNRTPQKTWTQMIGFGGSMPRLDPGV